jgi:hypothetical protein
VSGYRNDAPPAARGSTGASTWAAGTPQCRARVASLDSCFGRGAVLVLVRGITVTEPAHPSVESRTVSNRRVKSLLGSQSGRDAGDPADAAPSLGEPPLLTVSCAVSRPSSQGSVLQGLVSARAGRPHPRAPWPRPRHQRGTTRRRAAPRRARGVFPGHFVDHLVGDGQCWVKRE